MNGIDRSPARLSSAIAVAAAVVAVVATGLYSWLALGVGTVGFVVLVAGVVVGRRSTVTLGAVVTFVGVVVAGLQGAPGFVLLVAVVATTLAWDAATGAIGVGAQLGRDAPTARIELAHVTGTAVVGGIAVGAGYVVYGTPGGGWPLTSIAFSLLAAVLIASALR